MQGPLLSGPHALSFRLVVHLVVTPVFATTLTPFKLQPLWLSPANGCSLYRVSVKSLDLTPFRSRPGDGYRLLSTLFSRHVTERTTLLSNLARG